MSKVQEECRRTRERGEGKQIAIKRTSIISHLNSADKQVYTANITMHAHEHTLLTNSSDFFADAKSGPALLVVAYRQTFIAICNANAVRNALVNTVSLYAYKIHRQIDSSTSYHIRFIVICILASCGCSVKKFSIFPLSFSNFDSKAK